MSKIEGRIGTFLGAHHIARSATDRSCGSELSVSVRAAAEEGGRKLDAGVRRRLERSFDADLGAIRVHGDERADRLARSVGAHAFAAGPHLFFRAGAYRPESERGVWLLAHEVAHSIQQTFGTAGRHPRRLELLANLAADRVLAGAPARTGRCDSLRPLPDDGPMVIQRHASWEHRLLGDAASADLNSIAKRAANRGQLLQALSDYLVMWRDDPDSVTHTDINKRYPLIRTFKLKGSDLLVTYGELNTLPDYLANPAAVDELPREILLPILQSVRQEGYYHVEALLGRVRDVVKFKDAAAASLSNGTMNDVWESYWLNDLTFNLPPRPSDARREHTDSYSALLARNACHFAPYSWYRWGQSYDRAIVAAEEFHRTQDPATKQRAWMHHGYANHFLQDSFAAGHLVNKTLVMQWFVEWAAPKYFVLVPDWDQVETMTTARQPSVSAPGLYVAGGQGAVRDPQTMEEQPSRMERVKMSGVVADGSLTQEVTYQRFLHFLNNSVVQLAPLALHDAINKQGLKVSSLDRKSPYLLFGDNTMLNGGDGVEIASETAHMSEQSIQDVMDKGASAATKETRARILSRFPTAVVPHGGTDPLPIKEWHGTLRKQAEAEFEGLHDLLVGSFRPYMGYVSQDLDQDYVIVRLAHDGKHGFLGRNSDQWAVSVDERSALRLRVVVNDGQTYYVTDDGWWMSVGTAVGRRGYVGFYYKSNAGYPDWQYSDSTRRLTSSFYDRAPMSLGDDGYIYCWSDYPGADVELQPV